MAQHIIPNFWYNRTAERAGARYAEAFTRAGLSATAEVVARYPADDLPDFQQDFAGEAMLVTVTLEGHELALVNAGAEFTPNPSISLMVNIDPLRFGGDTVAATRALDTLWEELVRGGSALMPLGEYPFAARYGWVQDEFGVSWQLMLTRPEGEPRPVIIPALMFDGPAQNRAAEAAELYTSLLSFVPGGSEIGTQFPYGAETGKASPQALAFGEFRIGDEWIMASDNGSGVDHGFTPGTSLQVNCADQAEIDALWEGLSAVPEAEQCGWLMDRFGVSWQVVPANMGELMARPDAYAHLMGMKRIVIADL